MTSRWVVPWLRCPWAPRGTLLVAVALLLALGVLGLLAGAPVYEGVRLVVTGHGWPSRMAVTVADTRLTPLQVHGPEALRFLALPVVFAGLPLAVNWTALRQAGRVTSTGLLAVFAVVAGVAEPFCLLYLPGALVLAAAALRGATAPRERR